jgi:hypothetical protein
MLAVLDARLVGDDDGLPHCGFRIRGVFPSAGHPQCYPAR